MCGSAVRKVGETPLDVGAHIAVGDDGIARRAEQADTEQVRGVLGEQLHANEAAEVRAANRAERESDQERLLRRWVDRYQVNRSCRPRPLGDTYARMRQVR